MELRRILLLSILCFGLFILLLQIITLSTGHWRNLYVDLRDSIHREPNNFFKIISYESRGNQIILPIGLWTLKSSHGNGAGAIGIISLLLLILLIILTFLQLLHVVRKMERSCEFGCYFEKVGIEFFSLLLAIICPIIYSFEDSTFPDVNQPYVYSFQKPEYQTNGWSMDLQMSLCVFHGLLLVLTILETLHRYRIFYPKKDEESKVESIEPIGNQGFKTSSPKSKEKHVDNSMSPDDIKAQPREFINTGFRSSSPKLQDRNSQASSDLERGMENIRNPTFKEESPKRPPRHDRESYGKAKQDESVVFPISPDLPQIIERKGNNVEDLNLKLAKPVDPITPPESQVVNSPVYAMVKKESKKVNENSKNQGNNANNDSSKNGKEGKIYNPQVYDKKDNLPYHNKPREIILPNHHGFDNNNLSEKSSPGFEKSPSLAINPSPALHETDL